MTAATHLRWISEEEYLAGEETSPIKHEYRDGVVFAMAGAKVRHNVVATSTLLALGTALRGTACQAFMSDMKIRVRHNRASRFYYPDVSVVCESNPPDDAFQDAPTVVVEVLSPSTRRIDMGEKRDAYTTIPSLRVYLLIDTDRPEVRVVRRCGDQFVDEWYEGLDAVVPLAEIGAELRLREIYERVVFPAPGESTEESNEEAE